MGIMRQLITPFYKTRTGKAKRRTSKTRENLDTVRKSRELGKDVKALKKSGVLK